MKKYFLLLSIFVLWPWSAISANGVLGGPNVWTKNNFFYYPVCTNDPNGGFPGSGISFFASDGSLQTLSYAPFDVGGLNQFDFQLSSGMEVQGPFWSPNTPTLAASPITVIVDQVNGNDSVQFNYPNGPQSVAQSLPFKTITNAVTFMQNWYNMGGHDLIFSITNGTYNEAVDCEYMTGARYVWFIGNTNTWGATAIRGNTGNQPTFQSINGNCKIRLRGLKMSSQCTTSPTYIIAASNGGNVSLDGFDEFAGVGNSGSKDMVASAAGVIQINKDFSVTAGASEFAYCVGGGFMYANATNRVSFTNSCAFTSAFAEVDEPGYQEWLNTLFVNTNLVTGPKYMVQHNGFIRTVASDTRGFNDLPGSSSGVQQLGGLYNQARSESSLTVSAGFESLVQNGLAPNGISVTGSVFNFTNTFFVNINVFMELGTVSSVKLNGTIIFQQSNVTIPMQAGDVLSVTYSSAPTMSWKPQ